jgi:SIR2-like domain
MENVTVLLGAGASVEAGVPSAIGMTDAVIRSMRVPSRRMLLEYIRHTLAASLVTHAPPRGLRIFPRDAPDQHFVYTLSIDIEDLFEAVLLLMRRHELPLSAFVEHWHSGLKAFARSATRDATAKTRRRVAIHDVGSALQGAREGEGDAPERLLSALERHFADRREDTLVLRSLLMTTLGAMLSSIVKLATVDQPDMVRYLSPLLDLADGQRNLTIATLNYDRTVEVASESAGTECVQWLAANAPRPRKGINLIKLHGSVDWVADVRGRSGGRELPFTEVRRSVSDEPERSPPAILLGKGGKLEAEGPYLEMLMAWASLLEEAQTLLVVGYSFRDTHINERIARWSGSDTARRIIMVDPVAIDEGPVGAFGSFTNHLDGASFFRQLVGTTGEVLEGAVAAARAP